MPDWRLETRVEFAVWREERTETVGSKELVLWVVSREHMLCRCFCIQCGSGGSSDVWLLRKK